jgi:MoaA/NifB/PqqE/SkfB family radical SAM enzyme
LETNASPVLNLAYVQGCNLKCRCCDAWKFKTEFAPGLHLALRNAIHSYSHLYPNGRVIFSGGEPLLDPEIHTLVREASQAGLRPQLVTNGILLSEEKLKELIEAGLTHLTLPLEGVSSVIHDEIRETRSKSSHHAVVKKILDTMLQSIKIPVHINTIISGVNLEGILDLQTYCDSHPGIRAVNYSLIMPAFRQGVDHADNYAMDSPVYHQLGIKELDSAQRILEQLITLKRDGSGIDNSLEQIDAYKRWLEGKERAFPLNCTVHRNAYIIKEKGELFHCQYFQSIGNIVENTLDELLSMPLYQKHCQFITECKKVCHLRLNCFYESRSAEFYSFS